MIRLPMSVYGPLSHEMDSMLAITPDQLNNNALCLFGLVCANAPIYLTLVDDTVRLTLPLKTTTRSSIKICLGMGLVHDRPWDFIGHF